MNHPSLTRLTHLLLALWLAAMLLAPARTRAQDVDRFTVTATEDLPDADLADDVCDAAPGSEVRCTLRAAIMQANVNPGRQIVLLQPTVYRLTIPGARETSGATGDLNILQDLSIELAPPSPGTPQSRLPATIDATGLGDRVMFLSRLSSSAEMAVSIRAVQLVGGDLSGVGIENDDPFEDAGGAMHWGDGGVQLTNVTISGNSAGIGGGLVRQQESQGTPALAFFQNVTIAGNIGMGMVASQTNSNIAMENSIVANNYWSATVGGQTVEDLVWSYLDPILENPKIKGLLCFFNERVDLYVDGELQPRPLTLWS